MAKPTSSEISVRERRLRPIYDLLDSSNNKRVVQEVDRLLKKQPNFICAKVLKALALLRMHKVQECLSIVSPIVEELTEHPMEDNTLQALSICYRELEQPEMVCIIYESACKFEKSEDLLTHCFMAYARVGDFQNQYQTAMTLYKMFKKWPYFCWAMMSLVAKAMYDPDPDSKRVTLPLAERMMTKFMDENKVETDQETSLHVLILRKQKNYAKLLELLENTVRPTIASIAGSYHQLKIECLQQTKQIEVLAQYLENTILGSPNEWQYYSEYICLVDSIGDTRVEQFLLKVLDLYRSEIPPKSTLLAFLYLYNTLAMQNMSPKSDLLVPMQMYMKHYGHKASCFMDISPFVAAIPVDDFKKYILVTPAKHNTSEPCDIHDLRRAINYLHFSRFLMRTNFAEISDVLRNSEQLVKRYVNLTSKEKLTECSAYAELLLSAALILVDSSWTRNPDWVGSFKKLNANASGSQQTSCATVRYEGSEKHDLISLTNGVCSTRITSVSVGQVLEEDFPVLICCAILAYAIENHPANAQIRILLSKLYIRFGAVGAAINVLKKLDLKYIQYESMGYLYIWKLPQSGHLHEGLRTIQAAENFYTSYQKENMEYVLSAYKYGAWENVLEFSEFRKSLLNSIQFYLIKVEKTLLEYFKDGVSHTQTLQIHQKGAYNISSVPWDELTDGRDLTALNTYRPNPCLNKWREITMAAEKYRLKVRGLLLLLMNDAIRIMDPSLDDEGLRCTLDSMTDNTSELEKELEKNTKDYEVDDLPVDGMWPPSISTYIASGYVQVLIKYFTLISTIIKYPADHTINGNVENILSFLRVEVSIEISNLEPTKRPLFTVAEFIYKLFDLTETLGFMCILMDVLSFVVRKGLCLGEKTKRKKGKMILVNSAHCQYLSVIDSSLKICYETLNNQIDRSLSSLNTEYTSNWDDLVHFWEGKVNNELLHVLSTSLPTVLMMTHQSYSNSLNEVSANIKAKMKYLNSIHAQKVCQ